MAFIQLFAVMLLAAAASAQSDSIFCPAFNGILYNWNPLVNRTLYVRTSFSEGTGYLANMNCYFDIRATIAGRVIITVQENSIDSYDALISIRTTTLTGYLASWNRLTYNVDMHGNFISTRNTLFISFTTSSPSIQPGVSRGVRLSLTFLGPNDCPPRYTPVTLAGRPHCAGRPTDKTFQFGEAQRYCNLQRSNLLISDQNNVSTVLSTVGAVNNWIGMTAEPSGSYSAFRWLNNIGVSSSQSVACTGDCRPGSTAHRCVYAWTPQALLQSRCNIALTPLCYMPVGGTDTFYAGSGAVRASGALLASAAVLIWSLLH